MQNVAALGLPLLASVCFSSPAQCERSSEHHRKAFAHQPHRRGTPVKVFSDWIEGFKEEVRHPGERRHARETRVTPRRTGCEDPKATQPRGTSIRTLHGRAVATHLSMQDRKSVMGRLPFDA